MSEWQPIETAPSWPDKKAFLVVGVWHDKNYTTDPWCVFRDADNGFARWPHDRPPTYWMPIPAPQQNTTSAAKYTREELVEIIAGYNCTLMRDKEMRKFTMKTAEEAINALIEAGALQVKE